MFLQDINIHFVLVAMADKENPMCCIHPSYNITLLHLVKQKLFLEFSKSMETWHESLETCHGFSGDG